MAANVLWLAVRAGFKAQKLNRMITVDNTIKVHSRTSSPAFGNAMLQAVPSSDVYLMDCIQGMKHYPDKWFDLAVVDPPYGVMKSTNPVLRKAKMGKLSWDIAPDDDYWIELFRVSKNVFVFGAQYFELPKPKTVVFWDKKNYNPLYGDGELCFYYGELKDMRTIKRNLGGVIKIELPNREDKIHPTQKPVELYDKILHFFAKKDFKILDTHLGSQSSRISAYKYQLNFVGFETDEEYFNKGNKRYDDFVSQTRLF